MRYAPNESANAALAIVINLLDRLVDKGALDEGERLDVLLAAEEDLQENSVSNKASRKVIDQIRKVRYLQSR